MKIDFYSAKLTNWNEITVVAFSSKPNEKLYFELFENEKRIQNISIKITSLQGLNHISLKLEKDVVLGNDYVVQSNVFGLIHVDMSLATSFSDFDDRYSYDGDDLGPIYQKEKTTFAIWAPLASSVLLKYKSKSGAFCYEEMNRTERGVFRHTLNGDNDGLLYSYIIYNNGIAKESVDLYAKSGDSNSKMSYVIDPSKTNIDLFIDKLKPLDKSEMSIYECSVRDMTSYPKTKIVNKGKFLGLTETKIKTKNGLPVGLDYLASLGVSHIQLLPVLDFGSVDEDKPNESYNWGYDPMHLFVLEGSYASDPNDPYARIIEFKKMIREFHKKGLRVVLDVVYNHVYKVTTSPFTKTVPEYYFRHLEDGRLANCSYCGNDFASERKMARKIIIDSLCYLVEECGVDGFRFDLMSLIDVKTINEAYLKIKSIKEDVVFYGEGWEMGAKTFDNTPLTTLSNAKLCPNVGFFNDRVRDIVRGRGPGHETVLEENGYILGNDNFISGFKFVACACAANVTYEPLFIDPKQSINFVECHDNGTLFDILSNSFENEGEVMLRIRELNKTLNLLPGIPFFHMGQEIGQTKYGHTNTYNEGNKFNQFNYELLDKRQYYYDSFRCYNKMRKDLKIASLNKLNKLDKNISFDIKSDFFIVNYKSDEIGELSLYFNNKNSNKRIAFEEDKEMFCPSLTNSKENTIRIKDALLGPCNVYPIINNKK